MASLPTSLRHVRPVQPLDFPSSDPEWEMPESLRHARMCELLYQLLTTIVGAASSVGADQFVYFDGSDPKKRLAPDAFVKLGVPQTLFDTWRTWELGAPELSVEVISPSNTREYLPLAQKLSRYAALGTRELVVFDADTEVGKRLRVFDRIDGDWLERIVEHEAAPCTVLGPAFAWVVAPAPELPAALRLTKNGELVETPLEHEKRRVEALEREIAELKRAR